MNVLSVVKSWDFLGPEVKFRINKQENFKTIFGGMISILYYIAFISFFLLFGGDFFFKKNPKIVSQVLTDPTGIKKIELSESNFFFAFRLSKLDNQKLELDPNPALFNFSHQFYTKKSSNITYIPFKSCSINEFQLFNYSRKEEYFCVDFSSLKNKPIGGHFDTLDIFTAILGFNLNINVNLFKFPDRVNKTEEFSKLLKNGIYLEMLMPQPIFDPNDFESPLRFENKFLFSVLTRKSNVLDQVYLYDYVVETDGGILFDSVSSTNLTGYGNRQQHFSIMDDEEFSAKYLLEISYEKLYYQSTRQYIKLQDLLGNINGFMELIMFIFSLFISFNSDYRLNKYIANKLIYIVDLGVSKKDDVRSNQIKLEDSENCKDENFVKNFGLKNKELHSINNSNSNNKSNFKKDMLRVEVDKNDIKEENSDTQNKLELVISSVNLIKSDRKELITNKKIDACNNPDGLFPEAIKDYKLNEDSMESRIKLSNEIQKLKNTNQRILEYSFCDHFFKGKICKYKNNYDKQKSNRDFAEEITEKAFKKFDILFYMRFANEFDNLKKVILDEFQSKILTDYSKSIYFYKHFKKEDTMRQIKCKKFNENVGLLSKYFVDKYLIDQLTETDKRLFGLFDGIM